MFDDTAHTDDTAAAATETTTPAPARICVAHGDGIGPEIMRAALRVLRAGGARLDCEEIALGESVFAAGHSAGIAPETMDALRRNRVIYKAPITTPQGKGYKSLNVTLRKSFGLFANIRPCTAYAPAIATRHPTMDLVIVRENEEDLYAGIEHRQTDEVYQCLKLVSRPGCERIVRYAFDYARAHGRRKVTCLTKDNIMKLTDGLFHQVFREIATEYPDIAAEHMIIDIGAARLADTPEQFDVIVTPNLYGDIVSDIAAQITGSVGLAPSANIGEHCAMFEAIHGSAPDIAGQGIANPSGLLLAGVMMLRHLGQGEAAQKVHNAWLRTIEDGVLTADLVRGEGAAAVGTEAFADAVISRLGQRPRQLAAVEAGSSPAIAIAPPVRRPRAERVLTGIDVFVSHHAAVEDLASALRSGETRILALQMITNRGIKVWPAGMPETFCTDHWRCRFVARRGAALNVTVLIDLLRKLAAAGVDIIKTENLYLFDGEPGFSLGQGQ